MGSGGLGAAPPGTRGYTLVLIVALAAAAGAMLVVAPATGASSCGGVDGAAPAVGGLLGLAVLSERFPDTVDAEYT